MFHYGTNYASSSGNSSPFIRPRVDSKYLVAKPYVLLHRNLFLFPTEFNHVSIVYPHVNRRHMTMQLLTESCIDFSCYHI